MSETLPRPATLGILVVVCSAAGFGLAHASLDVDRARLALESGGGARATGEPPADEPTAPIDVDAAVGAQSAANAASDSSPAVAPLAADTAASPLEEPAPEPTPIPEPPTLPEPAPEPDQAPSTGPLRLEHGRVAYLRCGADDTAAPEACPRLHGAERRVWEAIDRLSNCEAARSVSGRADLRVVYDQGRYSGIGFRDMGAGALPTDAVRTCLEGALRGSTVEGAPARLTMAFRFDVTHGP